MLIDHQLSRHIVYSQSSTKFWRVVKRRKSSKINKILYGSFEESANRDFHMLNIHAHSFEYSVQGPF